MEKVFGGDASPVDACSPDAFFFNQNHFFTELSGPKSGHVPSWPASDYRNIVLFTHVSLLSLDLNSSKMGMFVFCQDHRIILFLLIFDK